MRSHIRCVASLFATSLIAASHGQHTDSHDGVQRVPDCLFSQRDAGIAEWQDDFQQSISQNAHDIVLMLVVLQKEKSEAFAVIERREPRKVTFEGLNVRPLLGYTLVHSAKSEGKISTEKRLIDSKDVEPTRAESWKLVAKAGIDTQEINRGLGFSEEWYLLAANVDKNLVVISQLHVAMGINPPQKGVLRKIRGALLGLLRKKPQQR